MLRNGTTTMQVENVPPKSALMDVSSYFANVTTEKGYCNTNQSNSIIDISIRSNHSNIVEEDTSFETLFSDKLLQKQLKQDKEPIGTNTNITSDTTSNESKIMTTGFDHRNSYYYDNHHHRYSDNVDDLMNTAIVDFSHHHKYTSNASSHHQYYNHPYSNEYNTTPTTSNSRYYDDYRRPSIDYLLNGGSNKVDMEDDVADTVPPSAYY